MRCFFSAETSRGRLRRPGAATRGATPGPLAALPALPLAVAYALIERVTATYYTVAPQDRCRG